MALLPHAVRLENRTSDELGSAEEWCQRQWPHTHGATWTVGFVGQAVVPASRWAMDCYSRTWRFQREEDSVMFRLAWE